MKNTLYDTQRDLTAWLMEQSGDNSLQMARLHRNLRRACELELTPRQQHLLQLHYGQELSVTEIAQQLNVCPSTVSRTLKRAQDRLRHCLQYSF